MNMELHGNSVIDLQNIITICRGDEGKMEKYLVQFIELIPERLEQLKLSLKDGDRIMIRQILHKMSPQIQFFGVQNITTLIRRLEFEYDSMPLEELEVLLRKIFVKLEAAIDEVAKLINRL